MPVSLGGKGDWKNAFVNFEYHDHVKGWKEYFLVTMGYHVGGLIDHFFHERRSDFLEMTLHHFLALYLYGGAYMVNGWEGGGVIAFLHDIADITGNLMKILVETKFTNFTGITFVGHMALWAYTRMYVLPILIHGVWMWCPDMGSWWMKFIFTYMLSGMCFLHFYWFGIFIQMLNKYVTTGKTDDKQCELKSNKPKAN